MTKGENETVFVNVTLNADIRIPKKWFKNGDFSDYDLAFVMGFADLRREKIWWKDKDFREVHEACGIMDYHTVDYKIIKESEKSNFHLTEKKIQENIQKIVEKIKTERLPLHIKKVVRFGSSIKGKEKPHDIDILLIHDYDEYNSFKSARIVYYRLLGHTFVLFSHHDSPETITKRLLAKGMKGIDVQFSSSLDKFIDALKTDRLDDGFLFKVIWSDDWEKNLSILKQNPMKPYVKYIEQTKDWRITDLNIDTVKALEIGNLIKTFPKEMKSDFIDEFVDIYLTDKMKGVKMLNEENERIDTKKY